MNKPIVRTRVQQEKTHVNVVQPVIDRTIIQPVVHRKQTNKVPLDIPMARLPFVRKPVHRTN
jgi:hypothetical protein